jgi:hypothetical protein
MSRSISYRALDHGKWSAPVALGSWHINAGSTHTRAVPVTLPILADDGAGHALVIWNAGSGSVVARWVD